jgi:AraC-like DNA-binding protein
VVEYLARLHIREGLRRLRSTQDGVEAAARWVGYQSGNKFYARLRSYADCTPAEARATTQAVFERLLEQRIPLKCSEARR